MIKKTNMTAFFDTECPKCGHIAKIADDYVNNAEYTECPICGYRASLNKESNELKIEYGYGVIYISYQNRPFYYETFEHPLERHEIDMDFIRSYYKLETNRELADDVKGDTSGTYRNITMRLATI